MASVGASRQVRIFINYRHDDTQGEAHRLYEWLVRAFGEDAVFLDQRSEGMRPGVEWLEEVRTSFGSCNVFLSLIGSRWTALMLEREQARFARPVDDWTRKEIIWALRRNSGFHVIPVLVGRNVSFTATELPRELRALADFQAAYLRSESIVADTELLVARIESIRAEQPDAPPPASLPGRPTLDLAAAPRIAPPPDIAHCKDVLQMVDEGSVVPFLGDRMVGEGGRAEPGSPELPDAELLADALVERFHIERARLPQMAQHVSVTVGSSDLYRALRPLLASEYEPGPVHRFLARLPGTLERLGRERRYQLIVSTSFDTALERAFDDEREPYDLAVYMASGPDKGKFVHVPVGGAPVTIKMPNIYPDFPISVEDDYELRRTVIVKIHGAVDWPIGGYQWRQNYVVTEDDFIEYLSLDPPAECRVRRLRSLASTRGFRACFPCR